MSCIDIDVAATTWMNAQIRPTVAKWLQDLSLGTRLSFLVALIVFGVVTSVAYLEVRSFERAHRRRPGGRGAAGRAIGRRRPRANGRRRSTRSTFAIRCTTWSKPIRCSMRSRSSRPTRPATCACSRARRPKNARRSWSSRDAPSPQTASPAMRSSTRGDVRVAGAAARALRRGGHGRPGEPAPGAHARTSRRPRVRGPDHRARDDPRPPHRPPAASASRSAPSCGP